jgi:MarR-like DNA-binding transcriptional regulator SgrR of sgrS sRNA
MPIRSAFLAAVSVWLLTAQASADRPRYGGTLRLDLEGTFRSPDPAVLPAGAVDAPETQILPLVFDTLVRVDPDGGFQPLLASSWERDAGGVRWRFRLRPNVKLHDGTPLDLSQVVTALRMLHSEWRIATEADAFVIELARGHPTLLWELADIRNAIVVRRPSGELLGTGPFRIERRQTSRLTLRAHDNHWAGRPFLDAVQIELGRAPASRVTNLEAGRVDMAVVQPTDVRRLSQRQLRVTASRPLHLFALVFETHRVTVQAAPLRRTFSLALDRVSISRALLQGSAQPADALLPAWLSGYQPFVLASPGQRLSRTAVAGLPADERALTLRVNASDSLAQSLAERIAVDAREAGFTLRIQTPTGLSPRADLRLMRLRLEPTTPDRALARLIEAFGSRVMSVTTKAAAPEAGAELEAVAHVERALLEHHVIIPVVHVPDVFGMSEQVVSSSGRPVSPVGALDLANVWLRSD